MKLSFFLLLLFLAVSFVPISFLSIFNYYSSETQIITETLNNLDLTASLIESQIDLEVEKQILVLDLFTSRVSLQASLDNFNNEKNESDRVQIYKIIDKTLESIPDLDTVYILDNNGVVVASNNYLLVNKKYLDSELFLKNDDAKIIDFKLSEDFDESKLLVQLVAPLLSDDNRELGKTVLLFDASNIFLSNHIIGLGETGEYIIAKRDQNGDALFITPPRYVLDKPLIHIVPKERLDIPITQALLKNEEIFDDKVDYRDEPVLSVTKYIEKTDWGLVVKIDKKEAFLPIENLKYFTFITVGIIALFSILASIIFSKSISNPINKIKKATKDILNDKFTIQLSSSMLYEIQELSNDIYVLAKNLKSTNELKKTNFSLIQESEIIKNEHNLLMEQMIESEKQTILGKFSSMLVHDLRNPIALVSGIAMQMEHGKLDSKQLKEFPRILKRATQKMNHLIEDTLSYVRNSPLETSTIHTNELIDSVLINIIVPSGVQINLPEKDFEFNCDVGKMESIITNIIVNSINAINEKGIITIDVSEQEDKIVFKISDSGDGIPDDIIESIFQPLFTTKSNGTGLGLAICKNITNQHGGTISVTNNPTTFTVEIPKNIVEISK